MNIESALISKILYDEEINEVINQKVTPEFFEDKQARERFEWILAFRREYSSAPTIPAFKQEFPSAAVKAGNEPLQYLIDQIKAKRQYGLTVAMVQDAGTHLESDDTDEALLTLNQGLSKLNAEITSLRDENVIETWEAQLAEFATYAEHGGMIGIPTGFPTIDNITGGLQPEQLIILLGLPKGGKSTLLLRMALTAHQYGRVPFFVSFEMSAREQRSRRAAMLAKIDHNKLIQGRLDPKEWQALSDVLRKLDGAHEFMLSTDQSATSTVSGLAAKVDQFQPDVLFVDGVYLMEDELGEDKGSPQALTNITRMLKRLGQNKEIPIVGSTQALEWKYSRKRGLKGGDAGYTSSFAQDCDLMLGVEATDMPDVKRLPIILARSAPVSEIFVRWDWTTSTFEEDMDYQQDDHDMGHAVEEADKTDPDYEF